MNTGSFSYLVKQGLNNSWLNRVMTFASVGILTACLIIIGGAGMLSANVRGMFLAIENQNEIVVFIKDEAMEADINKLGESLGAIEEVESMTYVSKQDALNEEREAMGDKGYLLDGLENDNPYPASYRLVLNRLDNLAEVERKISALPNVDSVQAPTTLADTLTGIEKTMTVLGAIIIGILLIASIVVISNTIKLTVFARRKEITIMKYVGATNGFIKLPFIVEGITIGLISAFIAFFILLGVYQSLSGMLTESIIPWISTLSGSLIPFWDMWYWLAGGFIIAGVLIGSVGSASAMRKHLQV